MGEVNKLQAYVTNESIEAKDRIADRLKQGGAVPAKMTNEQVWTIIQAGDELGVPPTRAIASMYIINGRVAIEGELMLGLIYSSGKCAGIEFEALHTDEPEKQGWAVTMRRSDMDTQHRETFTVGDARRVKVKEKGEWITLDQKFVWKNWPRIMLRWRAIAACARIVFSDVIGGLYLPEELGAEVAVTPGGDVRVIDMTVAGSDETVGEPGVADTLLAEANELGDLLGFSAAKIRSEVNKAGPEHIDNLLAEWQGQVDALEADQPEEFDQPHNGSAQSLDLGGDE